MIKKYIVILITKTGREIKDGVYLSEKDMTKYIEKRTNSFKGLLISDYFALPLEDIEFMFFEDEGNHEGGRK